jgi:SulP family sulfate permease
VLLIVVLVAAPLAQYIPLAALSAILMSVAWNMGAWREFARLRTYTMHYAATLLSVFFLTVMVSLTVAVQVGIVLACFTFIYRISALTVAEKQDISEGDSAFNGISSYSLVGSIFFGAVNLTEKLPKPMAHKAMVLDFSRVIYVDSSGVSALSAMLDEYKEQGVPIFVYGLRQQPKNILWRTKWLVELGEGRVFEEREDARKAVLAWVQQRDAEALEAKEKAAADSAVSHA